MSIKIKIFGLSGVVALIGLGYLSATGKDLIGSGTHDNEYRQSRRYQNSEKSPNLPRKLAERENDPEVVSQPSRGPDRLALKRWRHQLDASRNYRAVVHAALSDPSAASLRVARLAIDRCLEMKTSRRDGQASVLKGANGGILGKQVADRKAACESGGGIDWQATRAVARQTDERRAQGDKLLATAAWGSKEPTATYLSDFRETGDVDMLLKAVGAPDFGGLLTEAGDSRKLPVNVLSMAWGAEVCAQYPCHTAGLLWVQCAVHDICDQDSVTGAMDEIALRKMGLPPEVWRRLRGAVRAYLAAHLGPG